MTVLLEEMGEGNAGICIFHFTKEEGKNVMESTGKRTW